MALAILLSLPFLTTDIYVLNSAFHSWKKKHWSIRFSDICYYTFTWYKVLMQEQDRGWELFARCKVIQIKYVFKISNNAISVIVVSHCPEDFMFWHSSGLRQKVFHLFFMHDKSFGRTAQLAEKRCEHVYLLDRLDTLPATLGKISRLTRGNF